MHLRATSLREFLCPIRMLRSSLPLSKGKQLISLPAYSPLWAVFRQDNPGHSCLVARRLPEEALCMTIALDAAISATVAFPLNVKQGYNPGQNRHAHLAGFAFHQSSCAMPLNCNLLSSADAGRPSWPQKPLPTPFGCSVLDMRR
jgi:hypothetical protein